RSARGLLTLTVASASIIRPLPSEVCHANASQVKASAAAPCHTNLQTVSYFGSFARLNPGRHHLQFVPGSGALGNHTVADGRSGNKEVRYRQSAPCLAVWC